MPSTSNEGRRRLCVVLITVGEGSEMLVEGRASAKTKSNCCRSSWIWNGVWAQGNGRGWGCGKETSRRVGGSSAFASANPRGASGQGAPSGVAGMADEAAALACPCWVQVSNRDVPGSGNNKGWVISEDDCAQSGFDVLQPGRSRYGRDKVTERSNEERRG